MPPEVTPAIVAFLSGAMLATATTVLVNRLVRRDRQATRSAVADLREEWLDPFAENLASLTEEEREQTRQVKEVHAGLDALHDRLDELARRFIAVRDEIRRVEDDALQARYREHLGLPDSDLLRGLVSTADARVTDRILTMLLRAARAFDLQTALMTAADNGRQVRLWLRRRAAEANPHDVDDRIHDALAEVLGWRENVEDRRRAATPAARALADVITSIGTQRGCFVQLGRAVFVTANRQLGVAFLTGDDLAYLEEHPELIGSPDRALARMHTVLRGRYLDLTATVRALTGPAKPQR
jgi:hypothetical protein